VVYLNGEARVETNKRKFKKKASNMEGSCEYNK